MAIVCIIAAVYNFDIYNTNQQIVSALLLITGIMTLSTNEKLNKILRFSSVGLAIWLLVRIWFYGN